MNGADNSNANVLSNLWRGSA